MKHRIQDIDPGHGALRVAAGVLPLAVAVICGGVASAGTPASAKPVVTSTNPTAAHADRSIGARPGPARPARRAAAATTHATPRSAAPSYLQPPILHVGAIQTTAPWLPGAVRVEINTAASNAQAAVAGYCHSVGGAPARCNHIADDVVAGAFVGGAAAAAPLGVPVGLLGGTVGGLVGAVLGTVGALPDLLVPDFSIPEIIAGGVAGADILGAGLGGLVAAPFALAGGLAGATVGGLVGAAS